MRAAILVVSAAKKDVPSTAGMQATVATSELFPERVREVVPRRMRDMAAAVNARDFARFGELAMRDSNTFHATCADTWPPIYYMNDASRAAVRLCEAVNAACGRICCAYTFDAGPNAVVFFEKADEGFVLGAFRSVLAHVEGWGERSEEAPQGFVADERIRDVLGKAVSRVILTGVGEGPIKVEEHLVDENGEVVKA